MSLRWAVLGASDIGRRVIPSMLASRGVASVAVGSRNLDHARGFASVISPSIVTLLSDEIPDHPGIDAVYITTPNRWHASWTERCLLGGKHVLCEKPLTWRGQTARTLYTTSAERGLVLAECLRPMHHPLTERMIELANGQLGELQHVDAWRVTDGRGTGAASRFSHEQAYGAWLDLGCYTLALARALAGSEPAEIRAAADLAEPAPGETRAVDGVTEATGRFESGATFRLHASIVGPPGDGRRDDGCLITCARGTIFCESPFFIDPEVACLEIEHDDGTSGRHELVAVRQGGNAYVHLFDRFADAVAGRDRMIPRAESTIRQAEAMERALAAAGLDFGDEA